ncbi:prephenate dehydratase [Sporothrix epigloea]|uniref:prephenate dehydratase n=1 Tax=Sporothrix epigloea TaxID=1892477 RepID=A0ABP0DZR6_9PEZI
MERTTVAFLGPEASYTHQATKAIFSDVFEAVRNRDATYGVVPFENSTHGPVTSTLAGLADRDGSYSELSVCGETHLAIHHYLLGCQHSDTVASADIDADDAGVPLTSLDHIARIYSHPQAFGQTAAFVRRYFPAERRPEMIDASSTSRAAELAAADDSGTSAAISSVLAAETTSLNVLARCIEDRPDNTTRFYILQRSPPQAPTTALTRTCPKSLVSFTVPHHSPGALADVLDCFRRSQLNITSINSLPSLVAPFHYLFFIEFEHGNPPESRIQVTSVGTAMPESPDERVRRVLNEVAKVAESHRLLGTWSKPKLPTP